MIISTMVAMNTIKMTTNTTMVAIMTMFGPVLNGITAEIGHRNNFRSLLQTYRLLTHLEFLPHKPVWFLQLLLQQKCSILKA